MQSTNFDKKFYDQAYYSKHLERLDRKDRFTRVKTARVLSLLSPGKGERIVDLGCGIGTMMILLASSEATMFGADYSPKSLALAKKCFKREEPSRIFRGICCDGRMLAMQSGSVDGVMAVDFTEHLDNSLLLPTIKEVYRILKDDGRFVIYTPNNGHFFELLKAHNFILKKDVSHVGLRTMKEYLDILTQAGFSISNHYFEPTHIPVFNQVEKLLMHVPWLRNLARRRICIRAVK